MVQLERQTILSPFAKFLKRSSLPPNAQHLVRVLASPSIFSFVRDFFVAYSPLDVSDDIALLSDPPLEASAAASLLTSFDWSSGSSSKSGSGFLR
ncbi:hypothetical protein JCM10296v2_006318 [Rhodotorula toruloides]